MPRLAALLTAFTLGLALAACGDDGGGDVAGSAGSSSTSSAAGRAGSTEPSREKPAHAPVSVTPPIAARTAIAPASRANCSDHRRRAGHPVAA